MPERVGARGFRGPKQGGVDGGRDLSSHGKYTLLGAVGVDSMPSSSSGGPSEPRLYRDASGRRGPSDKNPVHPSLVRPSDTDTSFLPQEQADRGSADTSGRGKYVVLEGPQGAGKTTIKDMTLQRLEQDGLHWTYLHEPNFEIEGSSLVGDSVTDIIKETILDMFKRPEHFSDYALARQYNAFRLDNRSGLYLIQGMVESGGSVISDRNWLATLVNQVALGKMTAKNAGEIYEQFIIINQIIPPDIVLIVERNWEQVEASLAQDEYDNAYRKRGRYYFQKAAEAYRIVGEHLGLSFLDNNGDIDDAVNAVYSVLRHMMSFDGDLNLDRENMDQGSRVVIGDSKLRDLNSVDQLPSVEDIKPKYIDEEGDITLAGEELLSNVFTESQNGVYVSLPHIPSNFIGKVMARLSRSHRGLKELLLTEFLEETLEKVSDAMDHEDKGKSQELFDKVFYGFGDDSVGQLFSISFMVEGASALAIKEIERFRLAAFLEQSTRYIPFNVPNKEGKYRYHIPVELQAEGLESLHQEYVAYMDKLFENYGEAFENTFSMLKTREDQEGGAIAESRNKYIIDHPEANIEDIEKAVAVFINGPIRAKALDATRAMLPIAVTSNVGVVVSSQEFEYMVVNMSASQNQEVRDIAEAMYEAALQTYPTTVKRVKRSDRGVVQKEHFEKVNRAVPEVIKALKAKYPDIDSSKDVAAHRKDINDALEKHGFYVNMSCDNMPETMPEETLTNDEFFDVIIEFILTTTAEGMSGVEARELLNKMSAEDRQNILQACMGDHSANRRSKVPRAFEALNFSLEIIMDYGIFRDLQRHRMLTLDWPQMSPALGYIKAPGDIADADAQGLYDESVNSSRNMYASMMTAADGVEDEKIREGLKISAQETLLLGTYMRSEWKINLRSLIHILELRTQPAGHEGYRKVCQEIFRQLCTIAPWMGDYNDLNELGIPKGGILQIIVNMLTDPHAIGRAAEVYKEQQIA